MHAHSLVCGLISTDGLVTVTGDLMDSVRTYTNKNFENVTAEQIKELMLFHLKYNRGKDWRSATEYDVLTSFSAAVMDLCVDRFICTQRTYVNHDAKRLYYLSMEFLTGKFLENNLIALGVYEEGRQALESLGVSLSTLLGLDVEAGLGNGGLGRLAACYLDSMATLELPGYGYGLRFEYGIFKQDIIDGWQNEMPDHWLTLPFPWEMVRPEFSLPVLVYGRTESIRSADGKPASVWVDWQMFEGVPFDVPIIGYGVHNANILRLWQAQSSAGFRLDAFNEGDYERAVAQKNWAENVTKVLYPADSTGAGKELRLLQEYFLVTCSIRDMIRRYNKNHADLLGFADKNAIQMNDTHPALSVAELMRCLVDEEHIPWAKAWEITVKSCAYTNHTLLPEALEKWPVELFGRVLPRHLELIYEINQRFLQRVELDHPNEPELLREVSLIEEHPVRQVRMANLAVVGSHTVNGVSAMHSDLLRTHVMKDFARVYPGKFKNVTNGITPRRWLRQCNPGLAQLITERIGDEWIRNLEALKGIEPLAADPEFQEAVCAVRRENKRRLAEHILESTGVVVHTDSIFDVQIKRLHMYKRQLLNAMHIIAQYLAIKKDPGQEVTPRTFIFGAKAAPSYHIAKVVIKLLNNLGRTINADPDVRGRMRVVFLPNYNVTLAEKIIPATELSEQISTAGFEASGTGNMKFALNGALTFGTWDGANVEIAQHVGEDNIFIFGHRVDDLEALRAGGYNPWRYYEEDAELRAVMDSLRGDMFSPGQPGLFAECFDEIMANGDMYFYMADFRPYIEAQAVVSAVYKDQTEWTRRSILNTARMGWFSSDRSMHEYATEIWNLKPYPADMQEFR
jgi:glycogen phosphorylase